MENIETSLLEKSMYLVWLTNLGFNETISLTCAAYDVYYSGPVINGNLNLMIGSRLAYTQELALAMKTRYRRNIFYNKK